MSTKIYHGWKSHRQIHDLIPDLFKLRQRVQKNAQFQIGSEIQFTDKQGCIYWIGKVDEHCSLGQRRPLNLQCSLMLFPLGHHTLIMGFGIEDLQTRFCMCIPGVRDYAYWNNSDRPRSVTERQWVQRRKDWEAAIPNGIPALSPGVVFELVTQDDIRRMVMNLHKKRYPAKKKH